MVAMAAAGALQEAIEPAPEHKDQPAGMDEEGPGESADSGETLEETAAEAETVVAGKMEVPVPPAMRQFPASVRATNWLSLSGREVPGAPQAPAALGLAVLPHAAARQGQQEAGDRPDQPDPSQSHPRNSQVYTVA